MRGYEMSMINNPKANRDKPDGAAGLSRRAILKTGAVAAGTAAGLSAALADTFPATTFGAPLVELHVPAGALTLEQKSAMIKGITDVVLGATKIPPEQARKLWVQLFETAEGGWGVGGQIFVPPGK